MHTKLDLHALQLIETKLFFSKNINNNTDTIEVSMLIWPSSSVSVSQVAPLQN